VKSLPKPSAWDAINPGAHAAQGRLRIVSPSNALALLGLESPTSTTIGIPNEADTSGMRDFHENDPKRQSGSQSVRISAPGVGNLDAVTATGVSVADRIAVQRAKAGQAAAQRALEQQAIIQVSAAMC
jgi:hypothetical protein